MPRSLVLLFALLALALRPVLGAEISLAHQRVLVLGDSITQDGRYVGYLEYYLRRADPAAACDLISIGLSSETISGLSEKSSPFPRPCLFERIDRALAAVKPQVVFACYGMNDGIYHPASPARLAAFQVGLAQLIAKVHASGARLVLVTPPVFDPVPIPAKIAPDDAPDFGYEHFYSHYDDVLAEFARMEVALHEPDVSVIDLHTPMAAALAAHRQGQPAFFFAPDGVHPGEAGHLLMARILARALGLLPADPEPALETELARVQADPVFPLIRARRQTRSDGWLKFAGYTRGETVKTDSVAATEAAVARFDYYLTPPNGPDARELPLPPIPTMLTPLPGPAELPDQPALPDVLTMNDGTPVTTTAQWPARREELKRALTWYFTGAMPPAPGNVQGHELKSAILLDGQVDYRLVHLSFGPESKFGFDVAVFTPAHPTSPGPAVVFPSFEPTPGAEPHVALPRPPGQGKGVNALLPVALTTPPPEAKTLPTPPPSRPARADPAAVAAQHRDLLLAGFTLVTYHYQQTGDDTTLREPDGSWSFRTTSYYPAYPDYDWGLTAGWAWGISRVIDWLETQPYVDKTKLIVTGHSRLGKAALIAGAFDERIALTAPAGSGAGGTAASRFTGHDRGGNEGIDDLMRKYPNWFSPRLRDFWGFTDRLPFDQHWLIALVAPRHFLSLEGTDDRNCRPAAVQAAFDAARPAFTLLGRQGQLGVNYAPHPHAYAPEDWAALLEFARHTLQGQPSTDRFDQFSAAKN